MKRFTDFIVEKRIILLIAFIIIAGFCGFLIPKVGINRDMTKYLPDDSSMKIGMDLMDEEFADAANDYTIRVMFKGLGNAEKTDLKGRLGSIANVDTVDYEPDNSEYNKDDYTKYVLHTKYEYDSAEEMAIEHTLETNFSQNEMKFKNDKIVTPDLPLGIAILAVSMLTVILIIMSASWLEPFLFLFTIGIAVVINLGTNIFLGTISDKTFSVAAVLQLGLSMDYSIILISRFRQELKTTNDRKQAMKNAIQGAFSSISSSSFTTVVGLLALVFMRFKIGPDMGIVLAKGVFLSVVCVLFILPGLILMFANGIEKTSKPSPNIPTGGLAKLCNKIRIPLTIFFIALFIGAYFIQKQTVIAYSMGTEDPIADIFPTTGTVVLLYDNNDDEKITEIAAELEKQTCVKSAVNYSNTIGKQHTASEMVEAIESLSQSMGSGMTGGFTPDESIFNVLYYKYHGQKTDTLTAGEFMQFISDDVLTNETFKSYISDDMTEYKDMLEKLSDKETLTTLMTSQEISGLFGIDPSQCDQLFMFYSMLNPGTGTNTLSAVEFINFLSDVILSNPAMSGNIPEENRQQLTSLSKIINAVVSDSDYTPKEMAELFSGMTDALNENTVELMYLYHDASSSSGSSLTMSIEQLMNYLNDTIINDETFAPLLGDDAIADIKQNAESLKDGKKQLVGEHHSRLILSVTIPEEGPETNTFYKLINELCNNLSGRYYLIGSSAMNYEMSQTFGNEQLLITLLTAIAIFIVVLITFRSIAVPIILVFLVQCGVYITVSIIGFQGYSIYFLALLIVQCILMGSTIDYGILFSNYYRDARKTLNRADALKSAYSGSMHTILTSGLVIMTVTGILGYCFGEPTVEQICRTISIGAACTILLIIFILPGILACLDRLTAGKSRC